MRTLALIPARAGSKSIPGKNKRLFNGKPLFAWAVEAARACDLPAWVSTDDRELVWIGRAVCPPLWSYNRAPELCADDTPMFDVVKDSLNWLKWDVLVLLQPTQPLRKPEHIRAALKLLEETGADSVVSVVQIPAHYSPDYAVRIMPDGQLWPWDARDMRDSLYRRQDASEAYSRDGTVYAIKRETIEAGSLYGSHCVPLVIPSHESVNLDTEEDWTRAEAMVKR